MSQIKVYIELHFGRRRPNPRFRCNDLDIEPGSVEIQPVENNRENAVYTFDDLHLDDHNQFQVIQWDKTDSDILFTESGMVDHWIKIREISIDGIYGESAMYNCCRFEHTMDREWLERVTAQGYEIHPVYPKGTDLRLNGIWTLDFTMPAWQWYVERFV